LLAASKAPASNLIWLNLDLGELSKTRKGAEEFLSKEEKLDQLYCSAGVMAPELGSKTADGIEMQLGTNVIAHHFLIKLLLPAIEKAAQAPGGKGNARICLTSSSGHHMHPGGFDKNDPEKKNSKAYQKGMAARWNLYGQSKRGNILDAKAWARRVGDKGIVVTSCNPGNLSTELSRHQTGFVKVLFNTIVKNTILFAPWYGSLTQLYANTAPEAAELNGKYLVPWARIGKENAETNREDQQEDRE
jgi:retinol dehydrogenase 12